MKYIKLPSRKSHAFTLVEMVGVLAVIGILTAMLIPKVFETINTARINAAVAAVNTVKNAVASHYAKYGGFADATGTLLTPDSVTASTDAANFDEDVLLNDSMLEKAFAVKIGDQVTTTNKVVVRNIEAATDGDDITATSASYDLDGAGSVETNDGALLCECVITGVSAADAYALKVQIDGADLVAAKTITVGGAATAGRVKYPAIAAGATGEVHVYVNHM
jgi:type II secretory pathway pseudopilin PulG